jgi:aspartate ammonia-lyase
MKLDPATIAEAAQRIGIKPEELDAVVLQRGTAVTYQGGDYLFHESTPREWLGLILEGEIDLVRGRHGHSVLIGVARPGAILSEGVMLDDTAHATSARDATGRRGLADRPRRAGPGARGEAGRVLPAGGPDRPPAQRAPPHAVGTAGKRSAAPTLARVRLEHDSLGERDVPDHAYYGVQTLRATENFPFSGIHFGTTNISSAPWPA